MTKIDLKKDIFSEKSVTVRAVIFMAITIIAFWLDLNIRGGSAMSNLFSFKPVSAWYFIFGAVLFIFYVYTDKSCFKEVGKKPYIVAVALLFATFILVGESFECSSSLDLIIHGIRNGQTVKSGICFFGYSVLMYYVSVFIFAKSGAIFEGLKKSSLSPFCRYGQWLKQKPFLTVFITLIVLYIPYIIASYPGIFLADEVAQIYQGHKELGVIEPWYFEGHLIDENVYYNNHHPIFHTIVINFFIDIGINVFHSGNAGVFLYSFIQLLIVVASVSYICRYLVKRLKVSPLIIFLMILYYAFSPRISNYMMVTTKDVYYSVCIIYFLVFLYSVCIGRRRRFEYAGLGLSSLGVFLFRNEGRYILLLSFVLLVIFVWKEKKWLGFIGIGSVLAFSILFTNVILPFNRVTPGSRRETLSIPFQQTARYIKTEGVSKLTQEEIGGISRVLPYDKIASEYDPNRSDYVKGMYYEDATQEDVEAYFKVWKKMFLKKPKIYLEATINNYYQYLYPGKVKMSQRSYEFSESQFEKINEQLDNLGVQIYYPEKMDGYREGFENVREYIANIPIISLLITAATYSWWILYLLFYAIYKKSGKSIALAGSLLGIFLICFMGPCNGFYCRYSYPLVMALPILTIMIMTITGKNKRHKKTTIKIS